MVIALAAWVTRMRVWFVGLWSLRYSKASSSSGRGDGQQPIELPVAHRLRGGLRVIVRVTVRTVFGAPPRRVGLRIAAGERRPGSCDRVVERSSASTSTAISGGSADAERAEERGKQRDRRDDAPPGAPS